MDPSKISELYRLVNPEPTDELIEKRTAAISELVNSLEATDTFDFLLHCISGAILGFEGKPSQDPTAISTVVAAIQKHQPAFSGDPVENALDLQAACIGTLSELLRLATPEEDKPDPGVAAAAIKAAIAERPLPEHRHLAVAFHHLHDRAVEYSSKLAQFVRRRDDTARRELHAFQAPEPLPNAWSALMKYVEATRRMAAADREELEVLWWTIAGHSRLLDKAFVEAKDAELAIAAATELADLAALPPTDSLRGLLDRNLASDSRSKIDLEDLVRGFAAVPTKHVLPQDRSCQEFVSDHPVIFPITWLCQHYDRSGGASGWQEEFQHRTGLSHNRKEPIIRWSRQILYERIAQRTITASTD